MKSILFVLFILVAAFILHVLRLSIPAKPIFDEVYYVPAARQIVAGKPDPNWVHPPLAKYLIGLSVKVFGNVPWGWRFPSVIFSLLVAAFFFLIATELLEHGDDPLIAPVVASLLYLIDGISFVQSRIAMLDMIMLGFLLPSIYFFLKEKYAASSVFLGLSLACKWGGLFVFPLYVLFLPYASGFRRVCRSALELFLPCCLVYALLFIVLSNGAGHLAGGIIHRHWEMLRFHLRPVMQHPYKAPWWKWVLLIRPIWYAYNGTGSTVRGIVVLPNPFLWWPALAASSLLLLRLAEKRVRFILAGVICFTVPWVISAKGGFLYYLLPASPFLVLALAYWLSKNRMIAAAGFAFALAGFVLFFPLYAYLPVSYAYFRQMMWLKSWI